jgi:mannose-6-phosphate isomerase
MSMNPIRLPANRPRSFYRDSGAISRFRGEEQTADHYFPEDWVGSTTAQFGKAPIGESVLPDDRRLAEAIAADPVAWLGADHVSRYGDNPRLLVKLLDAGERLPVHVHPDRAFAGGHLSSPFGKTEAWLVLDATPDAAVHLGFSRTIDADELRSWARSQAIDKLLASTNRVPVTAGDTILVPAGLPHAIGSGILLAELQEPTDFSIFLEWSGFDVPDPLQGQLGLPFDVAIQCVNRSVVAPSRLAILGSTRGVAAFPPEAEPFFRADRLAVSASEPITLLPGYSIVIGISGSGLLEWSGEGGSMPFGRGDTVVIPFEAGQVTLSGELAAIQARPPAEGLI